MPWVSDSDFREIQRQDRLNEYRCPKCGFLEFTIIHGHDFRFSNCGPALVECKQCGKQYTVLDLCTG